MAYVPPALRKREQGSAPDGRLGKAVEAAGSHENLPPDFAPKSITGPTFSQADIHAHYWDPQNESKRTANSTWSTLNSSAQEPDKLKYIVLFRDANPRWQSHGIIFVKSKLHILPGGERFRDDPLSMGGATSVDPSRKSKHGLRDSTHDGEAPTEEADVLSSEVSSEKFPADQSQVSDELQVFGYQHSKKERQEHDENGKPPEGAEKKTRGSANLHKPAGTTTNDKAQDPKTEDDREMHKQEADPEPPYSPDLSLYDTGPIAVFEQAGVPARIGATAPFRFAGYHRIASLEYLAPHSRELFQLLEQKFTLTDRRGRVRQKQRSPESWKGSLMHRWAVIQMEKDQEANEGLPPPKIEVRERSAGDADASSPKKSVNELLREMRLKD